MGLFEDAAGAVEAGEERGAPTSTTPGGQVLSGGDGLGPLGQVFGAEQLATNGAGEPVLAGVRSEQGTEEGEGATRLQRRDGWTSFITYPPSP